MSADPKSHVPQRVALVVLNMGGPADQAGVEPFLRELFSDTSLVRLPLFLRPFQGNLGARIAKRRAPEVAHNYARIGGGSPILAHTERQAAGAAARLEEYGVTALPVVAMRYSEPRARDAAARIRVWHADHVVAVSLYPQWSPSTGGSSLDDFRGALRTSGLGSLPLTEIREYPDAPFYLDAIAEMVRDALDEAGDPAPHVLFSAHGLPVSYVKRGDPYRDQIEATLRGVVARLPSDLAWSLSFQSRVGPLEWLRPYTDEKLRELAAQGVKRLLMVPLGFVSDHVETLYEMDLLYGDLARSLGIADVRRVEALNGNERFVRGLGDLAAHALGLESEACCAGGVRAPR